MKYVKKKMTFFFTNVTKSYYVLYSSLSFSFSSAMHIIHYIQYVVL